MNKPPEVISNDLGTLAEDAHALLTATADVAGEKVAAARHRLKAALESGKAVAAAVRDRTLASAKRADEAVRENPYASIGVALGVGVLLGVMLARRGSSDRD